jgi:hypothetical protein
MTKEKHRWIQEKSLQRLGVLVYLGTLEVDSDETDRLRAIRNTAGNS